MRFETLSRQADLTLSRFQHINAILSKLEKPLSSVFTQRVIAYKNEIEGKIDSFNTLYQKFLEQDELPIDYDSKKMDELHNSIYDSHAEILALSRDLAPTADSTQFSTALLNSTFSARPNLNLPKLSLPVFSGEYESWMHFQNLFKSTIHENVSLTDIEKFQYLAISLSGEASNTLRGIPVSAANYTLAWETLNKRYNNTRKLLNVHISKIIDLPNLSAGNPKLLRTFTSTFTENRRALAELDYQIEDDNLILVSLLLRKFDHELRRLFEDKYSCNQFPQIAHITKFLETVCNNTEAASVSNKPMFFKPSPLNFSKPRVSLSTISSNNKTYDKCFFCSDSSHKIYSCEQFQILSPDERRNFIRQNKCCYNCLGIAHTINECSSPSSCFKCGRKHHTLLHFSDDSHSSGFPQTTSAAAQNPEETHAHTVAKSSKTSSKPSQNNALLSCHTTVTQTAKTVLLGTALARVKTQDSSPPIIRLIIDTCSQISAVTVDCLASLNLSFQPESTCISGLNQVEVPHTLGKTQLVLFPRTSNSPALKVEAVVMKNITAPLPSVELPASLARSFMGLDLADPEFYRSRNIDVLLGADVAPYIFKNGILNFPEKPSCINTIFGWIVIGPTTTSMEHTATSATSLLTTLTPSQDLDSTLRKFWELESVPLIKTTSPEDEHCERYFQKTTYRDSNGRYVVSLPFCDAPSKLAHNRSLCERRFKGVEHRLSQNPELKLEYTSFFEEYLSLGHMSPAQTPSTYVIPHHAVIKSSSSTTKVRAVFDGSCSNASGLSLNQLLHKGPKLQPELSDIIFHFRTFKILVCADIRMMYRQILLNPSDRCYQHIFWRTEPTKPLMEYELNTVTYGLTPSAFLAQRTLHQLVKDEGHNFPLASKAVLANTYVDDILTGSDSLEGAFRLKIELKGLSSLAGFELRKWYSNSAQVIADIPESDLEKGNELNLSDGTIYQVLGLNWQRESDAFTYSIQPFSETSPITKRTTLSYLARIFDPVGWLSPITLWAKHFIQLLWQAGLDWDQVVPVELQRSWKIFTSQFANLSQVSIPRYVPFLQASTIRLVGFSDASQIGYGAVLYLILATGQGVISSHLLMAKGKVSPTKTISIPRLELCAAFLLAKLFKSQESLLSGLHITSTHFFSDSAVVLYWLRKSPHLLKTFVANRVVQILEISQPSQWHYIPSQENPADMISRGSLPEPIIQNQLWWKGPVFLCSDFNSWSLQPVPNVQSLPDLKVTSLITVTPATKSNYLLKYLENYSSLIKALHVFAYVKRFIRNARYTVHKNSSLKSDNVKNAVQSVPAQYTANISTEELNLATMSLIKLTQISYFYSEINALQAGEDPSARLRPLSLFLDSEGLVRVGGRLKHSHLSYASKFPLLIPKESHFAILISDHYHIFTLHGGVTITQHIIQRKYWIVGLRGLLRKRIHRCPKCYLFKASAHQPKMADLPPSRLTRIRAFYEVGVDFAGPFSTKEHSRRNSRTYKTWLCVFVCMSTKAIHIEIASSLSTENFLDVLDRFVARRGLPFSISSDRGTNFIGAARQMKEVGEFLSNSSSTVERHLSLKQIKWIFNPPAAPNFGGLWEAAVKSIKHHLVRLLTPHPLTYEEFSTISCKVEAVLNSRPLCAISSDPNDGTDYLTPGHFIIGAPLLETPEISLLDVKLNRISRWQLIRQLNQSLWARWSREYLSTLTKRNKWSVSPSPLNVGDVVYVLGFKSPPQLWPIGRITQLFYGSDGIARSASVQTQGTSLIRPLNKLVPLPQEN